MPRRPRPASRRPKQDSTTASVKSNPAPTTSHVKINESRHNHKSQQDDSDLEVPSMESAFDEFFEEGSSGGSSSGRDSEDDLEDHDFEEEIAVDAEPDIARVTQWVDEEDLDEVYNEESDSSEEPEDADDLRLEAGLQSLSFGALRKAQKALANTQAVTDSEDEDPRHESEPEEEPSTALPQLDKGKWKERPGRQTVVPKRKNKHAPMEMSSKRPVPRTRYFAEEKVVPRDPRFLPITGDLDAKRFHAQYSFLSDMHEEEMKTLRENLRRARKLLANSPRDLREEREVEVERLERAVKRAESSVNKDRRETVELDALSKAAKEEREKRKQGKNAWYMKSTDKKALLLRAKYDDLAASGGRGAVRKAIEKKQKKVNQKEKKKRPFVAGPPSGPRGGSAGEGGPARKRAHSGDGGQSNKRPRHL